MSTPREEPATFLPACSHIVSPRAPSYSRAAQTVMKYLQTQRVRLWSFHKLEMGAAGSPRRSTARKLRPHFYKGSPGLWMPLCSVGLSLLVPSDCLTFVAWLASVVTGYTESQTAVRADNTALTLLYGDCQLGAGYGSSRTLKVGRTATSGQFYYFWWASASLPSLTHMPVIEPCLG